MLFGAFKWIKWSPLHNIACHVHFLRAAYMGKKLVDLMIGN